MRPQIARMLSIEERKCVGVTKIQGHRRQLQAERIPDDRQEVQTASGIHRPLS